MARKPKPNSSVSTSSLNAESAAPAEASAWPAREAMEFADAADAGEQGVGSAADIVVSTPAPKWEKPLAPLDVATLTQISDRLRAAYSQLVEQFPPRARSMGGMAAWLGVSKSTAQRVYEGIASNRSAIDALRRLPGPSALRAVAESARNRLGEVDQVTAALAAVEQFEHVISSTSRSRQAFVDMLSMGIGDASAAMPTKAERRALYAAALKVCGESLNVKSAVSIIEPGSKPSMLTESVLVGMLGARRRSFARPVVASLLAGYWSRASSPGNWAGELKQSGREGKNELQAEIVDKFCTGAVRPVKLEGIDSRTALLIDFPDTPDRDNWLGPLDVAVRFRSPNTPNPLHDAKARLCAAVRIQQPTQLLVHDIYLHESLASKTVPEPGLFSFAALPGDLPGSGPGSNWFERLPDDTKVMVLGAGAIAANCEQCPRHTELAAHAISTAKIDTRAYIGYRCLVDYPVWLGEYRVNFPVRE